MVKTFFKCLEKLRHVKLHVENNLILRSKGAKIKETFSDYSFHIIFIKIVMNKNCISVCSHICIFSLTQTNSIVCFDSSYLVQCFFTISHLFYSRTSLKRTSSKADNSLRRTKYFVPNEFLRNPLQQNLSKADTLKWTLHKGDTFSSLACTFEP